MQNKEQNPKKQDVLKKVFTRSDQDIDLKKQLIAGPELFITDKGSDEYLDKLALKIKLIGGGEFVLSDYINNLMAEYESKFKKAWFYRLADLYQVDRSVMDKYVKPEFVRQFIIQFIYGRFPYLVLRTLRSKNRRISKDTNRTKLFQHLTRDASDKLDVVIEQVYAMMGLSATPLDFKMKYSKEYEIYFQLDLGF